MNPDFEKIIEAGSRAPSGDNSQPWLFDIDDNSIVIYNNVNRDSSLYNYNQTASLIAIGACIENMIIAAGHFGYTADLVLFPDLSVSTKVAIINLSAGLTPVGDLYGHIIDRCNNRKAYQGIDLDEGERTALLGITNNFDGASLFLVEGRESVAKLSEAGGKNEKLVLENYWLHKFLFDQIAWSAESAASSGEGVYVKTLEMPPPAQLIFKLCSNWKVMKFFNKFHLADLICQQNTQLYKKTGAYGVVVARSDSPRDIVQAGRMIEKVWLSATKLGLSFNAMAGLVLLAARIRQGGTEHLTLAEQEVVRSSYSEIIKIFGIQHGFALFVFRLGHSLPPSARSYRMPIKRILCSSLTE